MGRIKNFVRNRAYYDGSYVFFLALFSGIEIFFIVNFVMLLVTQDEAHVREQWLAYVVQIALFGCAILEVLRSLRKQYRNAKSAEELDRIYSLSPEQIQDEIAELRKTKDTHEATIDHEYGQIAELERKLATVDAINAEMASHRRTIYQLKDQLEDQHLDEAILTLEYALKKQQR